MVLSESHASLTLRYLKVCVVRKDLVWTKKLELVQKEGKNIHPPVHVDMHAQWRRVHFISCFQGLRLLKGFVM